VEQARNGEKNGKMGRREPDERGTMSDFLIEQGIPAGLRILSATVNNEMEQRALDSSMKGGRKKMRRREGRRPESWSGHPYSRKDLENS